jgi:hypothetical protein
MKQLHVLLCHRLLLEAGRFEGLLTLREDLQSGGLAIPHGPKIRASNLNYRTAAPGSRAQQEEDDDPIARFEDVLRLSVDLFERLKELIEGTPASRGPR